jgi:DNA polymerase IV
MDESLPIEKRPLRKIIHIDMDAYYASIEQRDNPDLKGKPVAVGGSPEGRGGVVATASYEARKFGVRSAMSSKQAQQLCPQLIFIRPRFDVYKEVSGKIREIFHRYTDIIEPLSLDEAYLDVTNDKLNIGSAIDVASAIRTAIREELNLTASAGISINKFVAKIASDFKKPNGQTFIGPSRIERFMEELPVEKFFGVGKVTAQKMKGMGIHTGADLKKLSEGDLVRHFGKSGRFYFKIVRGIDDRQVQPHRDIKSIGAEDTFPYDLKNPEDMHEELDKIAKLVFERLQRKNVRARTITVKVKYFDFKSITRSFSFASPVNDQETISATAKRLLDESYIDKRVRLLGISMSNFGELMIHTTDEARDQLKLF